MALYTYLLYDSYQCEKAFGGFPPMFKSSNCSKEFDFQCSNFKLYFPCFRQIPSKAS